MSDWSDCPSAVVDGMRVYRAKPGPLLFAGYTRPGNPERWAGSPPPRMDPARRAELDHLNEIFDRADALFATMDDE